MKIALVGLGTTGKVVAEYLYQQQALTFVFCRESSPDAGRDLGEVLHRPYMGITIESTENLEDKLNRYKPDVLIDFSSSKFLRDHLVTLAKHNVQVVTAVTDYTQMDKKRMKVMTRKGKIGVVLAPNITLGVNVVLKMAAQIASVLHTGYDYQVIEENHRNKKDSPSGTAEKLAVAIKGVLEKIKDEDHSVPIHSIRAGDITGRHKVLVCGEYDQIEITHTAFSRTAYAEGALRAAAFIHARKGLYGMKDVYGLGGKGYFQESLEIEPEEKEPVGVYA